MFFSLVIALLISFVILGYSAFFKVFILNDFKKVDPIDFIYGLLLISTISLLINLFIPLKNVSYLFVFLGLLFFIYFITKKKFNINFIILTLILSFFIFISANNSLIYDSKLYHLQTIKYNFEFKTILGLSNLEPRLGMNSIWHSFLSLFNVNLYGFNLIYFTNLVIHAFFLNLIFQRNNFIFRNKIIYLFLIISILYILSYSYFHPFKNGTILNNLGSPEVDTISMIFFIITISLYFQILELKKEPISKLLFALIFLAITIKISNISLFLIVLFIFVYNYKEKYFSKYNIFLLFASFLWIFKSILLSGCLIFPIRQTCFNFTWSLGVENVEGYKNIISAFNRGIFTNQEWSNFEFTIYSYDWFMPWFKYYFLKTELLTISLLIFISFLILNLIFYFRNLFLKKNFQLKKTELISVSIIIISLYLWLQAPEIRLGYGPIISITIFFIFILIKNINFTSKSIKLCQFLIVSFMAALIYDNKENISKFNENTFKRQFDYSGIKMIYSSNDFQVYRPMTDSFCNYFNGFCSYQGYKVTIEKTSQNYFLIKNNW